MLRCGGKLGDFHVFLFGFTFDFHVWFCSVFLCLAGDLHVFHVAYYYYY